MHQNFKKTNKPQNGTFYFSMLLRAKEATLNSRLPELPLRQKGQLFLQYSGIGFEFFLPPTPTPLSGEKTVSRRCKFYQVLVKF